MLGYRFSNYTPPPEQGKSDFEKLHKIFMQLVLITAGNVAEALSWLTELDKQYKMIEQSYGSDHLELMLARGFLTNLIANGRVVRYLAKHQAEILSAFQKLVDAERDAA